METSEVDAKIKKGRKKKHPQPEDTRETSTGDPAVKAAGRRVNPGIRGL